jgi:hypothetical protein
MAESIWWPEEAWYEKKALPFGFVTLSLRQLGTIAFSFLAAFIVSLPFEFPIAGFSFGGRAVVFCIVFGVGYMISSRRVRLLPAELQAYYFLRMNGLDAARTYLRRLLGRKKPKSDASPEDERPLIAQEMTVDDFKNPMPLVVSDRVSNVWNETKAQLFLDSQLRAEDPVSSLKPRYRLLYLPLPEDIGEHCLSVKLEGVSERLVTVSLRVKGKSPETDQSILKVK